MFKKYLLSLVILSVGGLASLDAQEQVPIPRKDQVRGQFDVKIDVDSVFLNLSVVGRLNNRAMAGLQREDFMVYEDGVLQSIEQFLPTESPFNLLLLLDVSGSTSSFNKMMKQAAIEFTREIKPEDRIAVATFNSKVKLALNFTNDRSEAEKAIKRIKSGGGTAFYDALMTSINQFMAGVEGRSAIVVFTDGIDNQLDGIPEGGSITRFDELYRAVQESNAIVYTIFLDTEGKTPYYTGGLGNIPNVPSWPGGAQTGSPGSFPFPLPFPFPGGGKGRQKPNQQPRASEDAICALAREQLLEIAEQTGGRMYSPEKIDELSGVYSEIADDLRIQYQVGYNSTNRLHDGKWRSIKVEVVDAPDVVIRTRRGYYARNSLASSQEP